MQIQQEEEQIFKLIDAEVESMLEQCKIQKNIEMVIKDGFRRVKTYLDQLKEKYTGGNEKEEVYARKLIYIEEAREARKNIRRRLQGQLLRELVLDNARSKRARSKSPNPETSQKKKKEERKTSAAHEMGNFAEAAD